jgi:virulence-associated protein VapD
MKELIMPYPPKVDPVNKTWVIAFDIKLDALIDYCKQNNNDCDERNINSYRVQIFNEIYATIKNYDFNSRMQNSLVFNNSSDATKAFKAISLGLKKSWAKYFIEKLHIFEIDPNSDALDLLELDVGVNNKPTWLNDDLLNHLNTYVDSSLLNE